MERQQPHSITVKIDIRPLKIAFRLNGSHCTISIMGNPTVGTHSWCHIMNLISFYGTISSVFVISRARFFSASLTNYGQT